jgi:hypothetical protein
MAKIIPLDKILKVGTEYVTDKREVLVIKKVGTTSTSIGQIYIDRKPTTQVYQTVMPAYKTTSNFMGLFDLGDLYNVVPPETRISFTGASGSVLRIVGYKAQLDPGEAVDAALMDRFNNQTKAFWSIVESSFSKGVDTAWPAGEENTVISLQPTTIEEYLFNHVVMASVANVSGGVAAGDWAIRFHLDKTPLEFVYGATLQLGIDVLSMPRPPAGTTELTPFTLADFPIDVPGNHILEVKAINTSGVNKSPTTGNSITVTVTMAAKYFRKG